MDFDYTSDLVLARPGNPGADAILGRPIHLLDDGFVRLVDYLGNDASIAQAARVSYGPGTKTVSEDEALIRYLIAHRHTSPGEMVELVFHLRLPLMVRDQLVRHRTANVNIRSYRYSPMDDGSYIPEPERIGGQSADNKQGTGSGLAPLDQARAAVILADVELYTHEAYQELVGLGVSRETARQATTVSRYTEMYFKLDLHNLFHFLLLRLDPHAQFEIREYARAIELIVERCFPIAYAAWGEFERDAVTFSATEIAALRAALDEFYMDPDRTLTSSFAGDLGLHGRQLREFRDKLVALR
jgi:thymidylate synthase (FAD)